MSFVAPQPNGGPSGSVAAARRYASDMAPYLVLAAAWQLAALAFPPYLFPSLASVLARFFDIVTSAAQFTDVLATLWRILAGLTGATELAGATGIAGAAGAWLMTPRRRSSSPYARLRSSGLLNFSGSQAGRGSPPAPAGAGVASMRVTLSPGWGDSTTPMSGVAGAGAGAGLSFATAFDTLMLVRVLQG